MFAKPRLPLTKSVDTVLGSLHMLIEEIVPRGGYFPVQAQFQVHISEQAQFMVLDHGQEGRMGDTFLVRPSLVL